MPDNSAVLCIRTSVRAPSVQSLSAPYKSAWGEVSSKLCQGSPVRGEPVYVACSGGTRTDEAGLWAPELQRDWRSGVPKLPTPHLQPADDHESYGLPGSPSGVRWNLRAAPLPRSAFSVLREGCRPSRYRGIGRAGTDPVVGRCVGWLNVESDVHQRYPARRSRRSALHPAAGSRSVNAPVPRRYAAQAPLRWQPEPRLISP